MKTTKNILSIRLFSFVASMVAIALAIIVSMTASLTRCVNPVDGITPTVVTIKTIEGVTAPAAGAAPVTAVTATDQYTGTVTWIPADNPFKAATEYTAKITLTAEEGFTLKNVKANFFTVAGATATNAASSGIITAVFPKTSEAVNQTPIAADFTVNGLSQIAGSVSAVTITPRQGKSGGTITIYYNGSVALPTAVGSYPVTFDITAAEGWNAKTGLSAGTLKIAEQTANPETPTAADFDISNLSQIAGSVSAVTITPKQGKSGGVITIYYAGTDGTITKKAQPYRRLSASTR